MTLEKHYNILWLKLPYNGIMIVLTIIFIYIKMFYTCFTINYLKELNRH